jgi:hypothetical protein
MGRNNEHDDIGMERDSDVGLDVNLRYRELEHPCECFSSFTLILLFGVDMYMHYNE